ncbi:hypothetical protein SARC_05285 [Sphaeroforma arctica JP610]|uniref:Chorismate mutase domain-containing protein n=1 Tax=Sphaeroforma arctica JP610 TaxID=667725 RepID=A0A0L0G037_9EUKA|nr:hypothetical protein SARC_05285 [Sphaeroforma arctica JP610]KNC82435.1 hypothetical protein SARC_05285 [Sphaeroforma arctica JP610]|eukprot:XP_014156337.1 hypothetical protein SARC_05285 [Sphaeroforma arctica JP610]
MNRQALQLTSLCMASFCPSLVGALIGCMGFGDNPRLGLKGMKCRTRRGYGRYVMRETVDPNAKEGEEALSEIVGKRIAALNAVLEKATANFQQSINTCGLNKPVEIDSEEDIYHNIQQNRSARSVLAEVAVFIVNRVMYA